MNWGYIYLSYLYFVLDIINEFNFNSLLDVGCGDGRFLYEVRNRAQDKRLSGLDSYQPAIDFARVMNPDVEWVCANIEEKGLFDSFDVITILDVLEHIEPHKVPQFLKGVHQYLNTNGLLIITVPSNNTPVQKKHYQHFDVVSLTKSLNPLFDIDEIYYLNRRPSKIQKIVIRLLSNRLFIINYSKLLGWLYTYYVKNLLIGEKDNCMRIAVTCRKR